MFYRTDMLRRKDIVFEIYVQCEKGLLRVSIYVHAIHLRLWYSALFELLQRLMPECDYSRIYWQS